MIFFITVFTNLCGHINQFKNNHVTTPPKVNIQGGGFRQYFISIDAQDQEF